MASRLQASESTVQSLGFRVQEGHALRNFSRTLRLNIHCGTCTSLVISLLALYGKPVLTQRDSYTERNGIRSGSHAGSVAPAVPPGATVSCIFLAVAVALAEQLQ